MCVCVCVCACVCVRACVCACMSAPFSGLTATASLASLALHSNEWVDYMHPPLCHAIGAEKACDNAKDW